MLLLTLHATKSLMDIFRLKEAQVDESLPELFGIDKTYFDLTGRYPPRLPEDINVDQLRDTIIDIGLDFERTRDGLSEAEANERRDEIEYLILKLDCL